MRRPRGRRGVSEVVATILLLAMTITLFASIFLFTTHTPSAQPQALTQFSTSLSYGGSGGLQIESISITHLAGKVISAPSVAEAAIYVRSHNHPTAIPNPFSVPAGLSGSKLWGFGQTWTVSLASYGLTAPDNLSVSIVAGDLVQYQTTQFADVPSVGPYFSSAQVSPASVAPSTSVTLNISGYAVFASTSGDSVKVNLTEFGGSGSVALTGHGASGLYYYVYSVKSPNPASATVYYFFLTATDANGLKSMFAVPVTVT
jgi:flagellin-like protein